MTDSKPDVAAIVDSIETEVARRRAAGEYPEDLLRDLRISVDPAALDPPELLAHVDRARTPVNRRPIVGPAIVFGKRLLRRSISWYVQPIAADQTRFNLAISRDLRRVERRVGRLHVDWTAFDRLAAADLGEAAQALGDAVLAAVATSGPPVLISGLPATLLDRVTDALASLDVQQSADIFDSLDIAPPGSFGAVVLVGLMPRLTRNEVLNIAPLVSRALRPGASLVIDSAANDGRTQVTHIDPSLQQLLPHNDLPPLFHAFGLELMTAVDPAPGWRVLHFVRAFE